MSKAIGATRGRMQLFRGNLIVRNTDEVQKAVADLLTGSANDERHRPFGNHRGDLAPADSSTIRDSCDSLLGRQAGSRSRPICGKALTNSRSRRRPFTARSPVSTANRCTLATGRRQVIASGGTPTVGIGAVGYHTDHLGDESRCCAAGHPVDLRPTREGPCRSAEHRDAMERTRRHRSRSPVKSRRARSEKKAEGHSSTACSRSTARTSAHRNGRQRSRSRLVSRSISVPSRSAVIRRAIWSRHRIRSSRW